LLAYIVSSAYKVLLLFLGKDVQWFAFAASVDYIVVAIFLFIAYKRQQGPRLTFSLPKAADLLRISYPYILAGAMVAIYGQTDKIMLKMFLNETEVGYYATATALCGMWTFVLQAIIDSMYPSILLLHRQSREAFERKNRQLYAIVFYVSLFVSIMFILFGKLVIRILYGVAFLPAKAPLRIITWYTAFSFLGMARNAWIVSEGKQKYLTPIYAIAAFVNVGLNVWLIPLWGTSGAALASLLAQVLTSIVLPLFIKDLRPNTRLMLEAILLKDVFSNKLEKANDD
jgi:O-antigen/teichoic acid export membrane protein